MLFFSFLIIKKGDFARGISIMVKTPDIKNYNIDLRQTNERTHNRWILVFYDSVLYLLCWLAVFVLRPLITGAEFYPVSICLLCAGYGLFFGWRFAFQCYKQIWRFGAIRTYARELTAGLLGAGLLVVVSYGAQKLFDIASMPYMQLIGFVAIYVIASLSARIFYFYLFLMAQDDSKLAPQMRLLLKKLGKVEVSEKEQDIEEIISTMPINELKMLAEQFAIRGTITKITQINKGYINRTYRVETLSESGNVHKYILQRINTNVFPDVEALMDNYKLTTDHLHENLHLPGYHKRGSVQSIRQTKDGKTFLKADSGYWRMMTYFDHVYSLDLPNHPDTFRQAGEAFGNFMKGMADIDASQIREVIPNFHNTASRYQALEDAIARDPVDRVKNVEPEIEIIRSRTYLYGLISDALESGRIPTRICHNDTNLNNILFDNETHLPVAIIDLDTVMPSSPLYDFGDSLRIGTNTAKDDEKDLSKVSCNLHLYEQYARGYLSACGDVLTKTELELLPYASLIITAEDGIRFLMDYINGDIYYNIYYPEQNLDRARTQLKLLEDMVHKLPQIKKILQSIYDELALDVQLEEQGSV